MADTKHATRPSNHALQGAALQLLKADPATSNPDPCNHDWLKLPQVQMFLAFSGWDPAYLGDELRAMDADTPDPLATARRK